MYPPHFETFHGLRHAYAREQYHERIDKGMSAREARQEVAELLGHGRDDVTRVYLGK
jgi:integrase/recombinase XerD